jgi:hypothetical protein
LVGDSAAGGAPAASGAGLVRIHHRFLHHQSIAEFPLTCEKSLKRVQPGLNTGAPAVTAEMEAFIEVDPSSDFSIDNLPYGCYSAARGGDGKAPRRALCVALGDAVVDLGALQRAGLFSGPVLSKNTECFQRVRGPAHADAWAAAAAAARGTYGRTPRR